MPDEAACGRPDIMSASRDRLIEWLDRVFETTGMSANAIAAAAKIDPSSIYNFQSGKSETMRPRTISRIAAVARIPAPLMPGLQENDAAEINAKELVDLQQLTGAKSNTKVAQMQSVALEGLDVLAGDFLIYEPDAAPQNGDIVLALHEKNQNEPARLVVRIYDQPFLTSACTDAEFRRPLQVDGLSVRVIGVVRQQVRVRDWQNDA